MMSCQNVSVISIALSCSGADAGAVGGTASSARGMLSSSVKSKVGGAAACDSEDVEAAGSQVRSKFVDVAG